LRHDEVPELRPSFSLVGGEAEYDPEGLFKPTAVNQQQRLAS
jgi:hypothetical protein